MALLPLVLHWRVEKQEHTFVCLIMVGGSTSSVETGRGGNVAAGTNVSASADTVEGQVVLKVS